MGLTGLEIFKLLPKTNCKDCGMASCLAFAMAMATGKASLELCPHLSETARETLNSASAPPVALVKIGTGENQVAIGNETVLFRHDKRFENPCALAVSISDTCSQEIIKEKTAKINQLVFDRIGESYNIDLVAIRNCSGNPNSFVEAVKTVSDNTAYPLVLISDNPLSIKKTLDIASIGKPLICGANISNYKDMASLVKKYDLPLAVKGNGLEETAFLVEKLTALGLKQLIIDSGAREVAAVLADQTQFRRLALKKFRPFGYPGIAFANNEDSVQAVLDTVVYIAKYAGIVVIDSSDPADILPLITLRLNLYTDPQKPAAVEPKIYEVLTPGPDSPVYITTNFSLTYFCVAGDVESSKIPGYILPVDTDGVSVLTGWAAGKFTPEKIAEALNKTGISERISHRKVIIPGGVAVLKAKLEEISGWEVIVGPSESGRIPSFINKHWQIKPT
jgi:acetyl-CoA decarbonylase/synthase complex subunit gamma